MRFSLRRDLALQLLALYLLVVGPVILAALVFEKIASERLEEDVKLADLALARAIAHETSTSIDSALLAVQQLSSYPAVIDADAQGMELIFKVLLNARPDINLIYRLDETGVMMYHYPTGPGRTVGWDFSARDYFQRALSTRSPLLSLGRKSPTTEQPVTTAVMPIWSREGAFKGVVATNIKLQSLSYTLGSIAAEHRAEEAFELAIIDPAGTVIAYQNPALLLTNMSERLPQVTSLVLNGNSGSLVVPESNQEGRLYTYVPIPSTGWGVVVGRSADAAFATPRSFQRGLAVAVIAFLAVGLLFWSGLSRQVLLPLEQLGVFSQTIGDERAVSPELRLKLARMELRLDQIGRLSRSLSRMEQAIQARLNELSTLLHTSAAVVSSLDSATVLNRILEQVERLMDTHRCSIVALDEHQGLFRVKASRGLSQRYAEQLLIDPKDPLSLTLRAIRTKQPIQISDTETDPTYSAFRPRARAESYRSILAVPLTTQYAPPSALLVYRSEPHVFSNQEIDLLSSFANHAAMAIENAILYERSDMRLKEQTHRLEALIQSMQDGLILEDLQGKVLCSNRRISELVDLPYQELGSVTVQKLFERLLALSLDEVETRAALTAALRSHGDRSIQLVLSISDQAHFFNLHVFDVNDSRSLPIGRGYILQDVTQDRELDRMKSSLIATVSHELRTPLASIKGYASTLLAEDVEWDPDSEREFLEIISTETDRLTELVNELLDMSRIEAGNLTVNRSECYLAEIIERASTRSHPSAKGRLYINLPKDLPFVLADPPRLEAVLRNLIENAAKYSGDQSPIYVSASFDDHTLTVRVEDEGPGIPPEHSHRIFERFYRIEDQLNRSSTGVGLGLTISQGFVRAHGGEIWLEPRPRGTCIAFSIPLEDPSSRPQEVDSKMIAAGS